MGNAKHSAAEAARAKHAAKASLLAAAGGVAMNPSARAAKLLGLLLVPAAVVATGLGVASASYSAFSATTSPSAASGFTTGTVLLSNDSPSTALFSLANLKPADTVLGLTRCIKVTSSGTLGSNVKMYLTGLADPDSLASSLMVTIDEGTASATSSCTGFVSTSNLVSNVSLASLATPTTGSAINFGNGLGAWTQTGGVSDFREYKITVSVLSAISNTLQGKTANVGFTWEAQNN